MLSQLAALFTPTPRAQASARAALLRVLEDNEVAVLYLFAHGNLGRAAFIEAATGLLREPLADRGELEALFDDAVGRTDSDEVSFASLRKELERGDRKNESRERALGSPPPACSLPPEAPAMQASALASTAECAQTNSTPTVPVSLDLFDDVADDGTIDRGAFRLAMLRLGLRAEPEEVDALFLSLVERGPTVAAGGARVRCSDLLHLLRSRQRQHSSSPARPPLAAESSATTPRSAAAAARAAAAAARAASPRAASPRSYHENMSRGGGASRPGGQRAALIATHDVWSPERHERASPLPPARRYPASSGGWRNLEDEAEREEELSVRAAQGRAAAAARVAASRRAPSASSASSAVAATASGAAQEGDGPLSSVRASSPRCGSPRQREPHATTHRQTSPRTAQVNVGNTVPTRKPPVPPRPGSPRPGSAAPRQASPLRACTPPRGSKAAAGDARRPPSPSPHRGSMESTAVTGVVLGSEGPPDSHGEAVPAASDGVDPPSPHPPPQPSTGCTCASPAPHHASSMMTPAAVLAPSPSSPQRFAARWGAQAEPADGQRADAVAVGTGAVAAGEVPRRGTSVRAASTPESRKELLRRQQKLSGSLPANEPTPGPGSYDAADRHGRRAAWAPTSEGSPSFSRSSFRESAWARSGIDRLPPPEPAAAGDVLNEYNPHDVARPSIACAASAGASPSMHSQRGSAWRATSSQPRLSRSTPFYQSASSQGLDSPGPGHYEATPGTIAHALRQSKAKQRGLASTSFRSSSPKHAPLPSPGSSVATPAPGAYATDNVGRSEGKERGVRSAFDSKLERFPQAPLATGARVGPGTYDLLEGERQARERISASSGLEGAQSFPFSSTDRRYRTARTGPSDSYVYPEY